MADSVTTTSTPTAPAKLDSPLVYHESPSPRKRRRSSKQSATLLPGSKVPKADLPLEYIAKPLTGAAALVDEQQARSQRKDIEARQTSPNPAQKALGDLRGSQSAGMSRPQDASSRAALLSQPLPDVAPSIRVAGEGTGHSDSDGKMQTSPHSVTSFGTLDSNPGATITTNGVAVASPSQMDDAAGEEDEVSGDNEHRPLVDGFGGPSPEEARSSKAFTYPGPMPNAQAHRTSSLPQAGYSRDSTRSTSAKRYKCPYCSTDFTRHHNLKSHLLTHSHEKPYSCDTCEARFRRLHDLKRHTKLHTGERPHVCPKCDRSFARGDALARHNKGQGGCAGRRSSVGSFGGDDKNEETMRISENDGMHGIMYTGEASHEPEHMDEDSGSPGGRSLPSIRKHEAPLNEQHMQVTDHPTVYQSRQSSTYPPVPVRQPSAGGLYPPPSVSPRGGSGPSTAQSSLTQPPYPPGPGVASFQTSTPSVFAQGGMTESPKPLSPAGMTSHQLGHSDSGIHRNRSPSLTHQFQQQQFGRRPTNHNPSPPLGLPPPQPGASHSNAPHLPSLPGLNPPEPRWTLHSQVSGNSHLHSSTPNVLSGSSHGPSSPSYPPGNMSSANNSLSSHSTGPPAGFERPQNNISQIHDQTWGLIRSLENKVDRLQGMVDRLQEEIAQLKRQQDGPSQLRSTSQHSTQASTQA